MNALAHFVGGFVSEGHAEDVAGHNADFIDEIGEPVRERPGFSGTGAGDDADAAFGARDGFVLLGVECVEVVFHEFILP